MLGKLPLSNTLFIEDGLSRPSFPFRNNMPARMVVHKDRGESILERGNLL